MALSLLKKVFRSRRKKGRAPANEAAFDPDEKHRDFFLHVHVPKCAGVTFNSILQRNFGRAFAEDYGLLNNFKYSPNQVLQMISGYPYLRCVASHRFSLHLPFETEAANVRAIVFARDPVEWVASTYFYHRSQPNTLVPLAKSHDFEGYVRERFAAAKPDSIGQTKFLAQVGGEEGLAQVRSSLETQKVLLFPVELFEESCIALEALFPRYFRDCGYKPANASRRDQPVPPHIRECIEPVLSADFKLHSLAMEQHNARMQHLFSDAATLAERRKDFRRRCALREADRRRSR